MNNAEEIAVRVRSAPILSEFLVQQYRFLKTVEPHAAIDIIRALCLSHERLRSELNGAIAVLDLIDNSCLKNP